LGDILKRRLKMNRNPGPREEMALNVQVASAFLKTALDRVMSDCGISGNQYNVLRILRGVYPNGHPRHEIKSRMIDRAPDLTRLIDRLERDGLVHRNRGKQDRRQSLTRITAKGLELLKKVQPKLEKKINSLKFNLSNAELRSLSRMLEKLYENYL
jgi:DNA-binding MarR family transcriptional regulator